MRRGGGGSESEQCRLAPAAFWASWAAHAGEASSSTSSRSHNNPGGRTGGRLFGELQLATCVLDRKGFVNRPDWFVLQSGARPRQQHSSEPCMVGSTSRLPLPNTTFGRPWYLPNHAPQTIIRVHTSEQGQRRLVRMSHST